MAFTVSFQPAYLELYHTGELKRRSERAMAMLSDCTLCPRVCHVNRAEERTGTCGSGRYAVVSSAFAHFGEEGCLRGRCGSGTIFFAWCNLRCAFCQNWETSWEGEGREVTTEELASLMLQLQAQGCHNINLVSPSHVVAQVLAALVIAVAQGLRLPLVYNSGGYDSLEALKLLDGVVDIYLPDFKFWDSAQAKRYCAAADYPEVARLAIREMQRQVGPLTLDDSGIAQRGLLLRHLVMPGGVAGTEAILEWVACKLGSDTYVNLMAQYHPAGHVRGGEFSEIDFLIAEKEFRHALEAARKARLNRLDRHSAPRE
jgi:putative pyruvate formate lyase activating enzyme